MIYTRVGFKGSTMTPEKSNYTDFNWLCMCAPQRMNATNADEAHRFKATEGRFFIAGDLEETDKGSGLRRSDNALKNRSLLALDFDDGGTDRDAFIKAVEDAFPATKWIAYPSASYGLKDPAKVRYRVVICLNRPYTKDEHLTLFNGAAKAIGFEIDQSAKQWSQQMGLPVLNPKTNPSMIVVHNSIRADSPLDVDKALSDWTPEEPQKEPQSHVAIQQIFYDSQIAGADESDTLAKINPIDALQLIQDWTEKHTDELQNETEFVKVLYLLLAWWRSNEITETTVHGAMKILAMGNDDWAEDNENKLHAHLSSRIDAPKIGFVDYFSGNSKLSKAPTAAAVPRWALVREILHDRQEVLDFINEGKDDSQARKTLSPTSTAKLLNRHLTMYRTTDEDGAAIYIYDPDAGIYKGRTIDLQRWVQTAEPTYDERKVKQVAYFLQVMVPVREPEDNPKLIPCANGIYDYDKKRLLPFSAQYFFIAKIATNWNPHAADKLPEITTDTDSTWNPRDFISALACGDKQIAKLLFEVIADAVNGNYSRGQAIFLLGSRESLSANGSNGKGTYQELIQAIVGKDNASNMKVNNLDEHFAVNGLQGKTVNIGDDLQASTFVDDSSNFNSAVTGDVLYTDVKYGKPQSFRFKGAMIQSTNEMPRFKNKTGGTYRRIVIVPFNAHFEGDTDNPDIKNDYIKRKEVREWFLCVALSLPFFKRFDVPDAATAQLNDFKLENDPIRQFVEGTNWDDLGQCDIPTQTVYEAYTNWCKANGFNQPISKPALMKAVFSIFRERKHLKKQITMSEWTDLYNKAKDITDVAPFELMEVVPNRIGHSNTSVMQMPLRHALSETLNKIREDASNITPNNPTNTMFTSWSGAGTGPKTVIEQQLKKYRFLSDTI
jgi:putative DNA primase/helicase